MAIGLTVGMSFKIELGLTSFYLESEQYGFFIAPALFARQADEPWFWYERYGDKGEQKGAHGRLGPMEWCADWNLPAYTNRRRKRDGDNLHEGDEDKPRALAMTAETATLGNQ